VVLIQGRIQPVSLGGDDFKLDFGSHVSLPVDYCKPNKVYFTTKQWTAKWLYIANAVFRNAKKHGEKSNFCRF